MEYFVWCDESIKKGKHYSNFYGGVLVRSRDLKQVTDTLQKVCTKEHLNNELKWQNVTGQYLEKYKKIVDAFFKLIAKDKAKIRIMFTQNAEVPTHLTSEHRQNEFFILYYHFFKHAFGLEHSNSSNRTIHVRAYFDLLPDTLEKRQQFKEYIKGLQSLRNFQLAKIKFRKEDITEVNSKEHLLMQCLDIVLGSMAFRLNDMHKEKPLGKKRRGKRTIAKEKLYKHINNHIRKIRPSFNIGISTGKADSKDKWEHPYRHWKFTPSNFEIDATYYK